MTEAENVSPVTDQPAQSTLHKSTWLRRCEEGLLHLTKGLEKTIDSGGYCA